MSSRKNSALMSLHGPFSVRNNQMERPGFILRVYQMKISGKCPGVARKVFKNKSNHGKSLTWHGNGWSELIVPHL